MGRHVGAHLDGHQHGGRKPTETSVTEFCYKIACVANVPVRSKRNFTFGPHEKWGEIKKVEGRGWGRGKKGTLARKPLDFEKRPLVFTVEFNRSFACWSLHAAKRNLTVEL